MIRRSLHLLFSKKIVAHLCLALLLSCNITSPPESGRRSSGLEADFEGTGGGLVYKVNPIVASGKSNLTTPRFQNYVTRQFITDNNTLSTGCSFTQYISSTSKLVDTTENDCFSILNDQDANTVPITSLSDGWGYKIDSDEFYQINTFYHIDKLLDRFYDSLSYAHKAVHFQSNLLIPPAAKYNFINTNSYWLTKFETDQNLVVFSKCFLDPINAFFSPADNSVCFGYNEDNTKFRMVQDPSVIYHEMGHALVKVMMNQRNTTFGTDPNTLNPYFQTHPYESDLGSLFYDEAGSINEGIADYFSYYMNGRTKIGEWALGRFFDAARPLTENDDLHTAPVSEEVGERLKYPDFIQYNTGEPSKLSEDVHYAGQITTHYLVALTEELKSTCFAGQSSSKQHENATNMVMLLLNETLAEVGDLTAKGSDFFSEFATLNVLQEEVFYTNLNADESFLWTQIVNPPNYRKFFRIFGKNILHHISLNLCMDFSVTKSETLLDEYGLLLFKSYEDLGLGYDVQNDNTMNYFNFNGSGVFAGKNLSALFSNSEVNEDNRKNTVLISKELIELDESIIAYIFDGQEDINNILSNLVFEGKNVNTTQDIAGTEYNNNNIKISPGEVVGLSINLRNKSNSTMAGVQILANDWDHLKLNIPNDPIYTDGDPNNDPPYSYIYSTTNINGISNNDITGYTANYSPCIYDDFPKASEGGVTDITSTTPGSCSYFSNDNKQLNFDDVVGSTVYTKFEQDAPQPICMVQYSDENETKWVTQDHFRRANLSLEDKDCLNNPSMSSEGFNPNECLIRVLPGADTAVLGKIDAQKTWAETLKDDDATTKVLFSPSNTVLFEVNKWIQPGTRFNCRFRVRFSNCSNCYTKPDDSEYADKDFTGPNPFKLINFQFEVID